MDSAAKIKQVFQKYDLNNDGFISCQELSGVLKSLGTFRDREITAIFNHMDKNGDGKVMYEEFVNWILAEGGATEETKARTLLQPSTEDDVGPVFNAFCGDGNADMDGKSFLKLCKDSALIDKKFTSTDVDLIFAKVVDKGKRRITRAQFEATFPIIASKKGISERRVRTAMIDVGGPVMVGTKTDAVRFHDDKSTYTGRHAHGNNDGVDNMLAQMSLSSAPSGPIPRSPVKKATSTDKKEAQKTVVVDAKPKSVQDVFKLFCGGSQQTMDNKGFAKLCKDCHLLDKSFTSGDADIEFSKACEKGQRRITLRQFEDAIWAISERKNIDYGNMLAKIVECGKPALTGTQAESVRFHDDKSTYTGMHAAKGGTGLASTGMRILTG